MIYRTSMAILATLVLSTPAHAYCLYDLGDEWYVECDDGGSSGGTQICSGEDALAWAESNCGCRVGDDPLSELEAQLDRDGRLSVCTVEPDEPVAGDKDTQTVGKR